MGKRGGRTKPTGQTPLSLQFDQLFRGLKERNPELAQRTVAVLRRLNSLATGATSRYAVDITTGSAAGSIPPAGAFDDKEAPPFHTYFQKFLHAPNDAALAIYVTEAEAECSRFQGGDRDAHHGNQLARIKAGLRRGDEPEDEKAAMERVVSWYEGDPPALAALKEGDRRLAEWIRKARRVHRRDEETGEAHRGWDGWSEDERTAQVRKHWDQGRTLNVVAKKLSVNRNTLLKYWPGRQSRKKAA